MERGTSEHVVIKFDYMHSVQDVPPVEVELTNGSIAEKTCIVDVLIHARIVVTLVASVLYLPSNLLPRR